MLLDLDQYNCYPYLEPLNHVQRSRMKVQMGVTGNREKNKNLLDIIGVVVVVERESSAVVKAVVLVFEMSLLGQDLHEAEPIRVEQLSAPPETLGSMMVDNVVEFIFGYTRLFRTDFNPHPLAICGVYRAAKLHIRKTS